MLMQRTIRFMASNGVSVAQISNEGELSKLQSILTECAFPCLRCSSLYHVLGVQQWVAKVSVATCVHSARVADRAQVSAGCWAVARFERSNAVRKRSSSALARNITRISSRIGRLQRDMTEAAKLFPPDGNGSGKSNSGLLASPFGSIPLAAFFEIEAPVAASSSSSSSATPLSPVDIAKLPLPLPASHSSISFASSSYSGVFPLLLAILSYLARSHSWQRQISQHAAFCRSSQRCFIHCSRGFSC